MVVLVADRMGIRSRRTRTATAGFYRKRSESTNKKGQWGLDRKHAEDSKGKGRSHRRNSNCALYKKDGGWLDLSISPSTIKQDCARASGAATWLRPRHTCRPRLEELPSRSSSEERPDRNVPRARPRPENTCGPSARKPGRCDAQPSVNQPGS